MSISDDKAADLQVKELEMIQAIINRLGSYGASLKNYCLTLVTAICGAAITLQRPIVAALSLLPILIFALLDAQYLRIERRFRGLFDQTAQRQWGSPPLFSINLQAAPVIGYWCVLVSWSILNFYLPLLIAVLLIVIAAEFVHGWAV